MAGQPSGASGPEEALAPWSRILGGTRRLRLHTSTVAAPGFQFQLQGADRSPIFNANPLTLGRWNLGVHDAFPASSAGAYELRAPDGRSLGRVARQVQITGPNGEASAPVTAHPTGGPTSPPQGLRTARATFVDIQGRPILTTTTQVSLPIALSGPLQDLGCVGSTGSLLSRTQPSSHTTWRVEGSFSLWDGVGRPAAEAHHVTLGGLSYDLVLTGAGELTAHALHLLALLMELQAVHHLASAYVPGTAVLMVSIPQDTQPCA